MNVEGSEKANEGTNLTFLIVRKSSCKSKNSKYVLFYLFSQYSSNWKWVGKIGENSESESLFTQSLCRF